MTDLKPEDFLFGSGYEGETLARCPVCLGGSASWEDLEVDTLGDALDKARQHIAKWHAGGTETP